MLHILRLALHLPEPLRLRLDAPAVYLPQVDVELPAVHPDCLLLQALAMCQTPSRKDGQCIRDGWGWYPLSIACASGAISLVSALSTPQADLTWNLILLAASLGALIVGIVSEWTYPRWSHWSR